MAARPSSRYRPMFSKRSSSFLRMNRPTSGLESPPMTLKQDLETTPNHRKQEVLNGNGAIKACMGTDSRKYNLCPEEKLTVMKNKDNTLLNKRTELFTKSRLFKAGLALTLG